MGLLEGKVGLVTGAASGIGRATAIVSAREGARVTVADIQVEAGEETVAQIRRDGGEAIFVRTDVSDAEQVEAMVAKTVETFGALNWACNNAAGGAGGYSALHETPQETWVRTIDVCLTGLFYCMKHEIPIMLENGGGSIVNISSAAVFKGEAKLAAYIAAKGGVETLSRTGASEYATRGIRVNTVCPGGIETPAIQRYFDRFPEIRERTVGAHAMRRLGAPEEIADAVVWLASDRSSFVTGASLVVDGGTGVNSHML